MAVVDALEDGGQLERREAEVEAEPGQVAVAARGIALDELVLVEEARGRRRIGHYVSGEQRAESLVDHQQRQVGERVADGGHLPVDDGDRTVVVIDEDVVEPVVAVHHAGRGLRRYVRGEPGVQFVRGGQVAAVRRVELLAPTPHLASQESLWAAEVAEPDRGRVDLVQSRQDVDQPDRDRPGALGAERLELGGVPVRRAGDPLHHVERRAHHALVLTQCVGARHWHLGVPQRRHHAELARHVVRRGEHVPQWRPSDDPGRPAVGHLVSEVAPSPGDEPSAEWPVGHPWHRRREPAGEPGQVEAGRVVRHRGHHGTSTLTASTTQAGFSAPSRSTVTRAVTWYPPPPGFTDSSSTPARTFVSTGTGEGKRTLLAP